MPTVCSAITPDGSQMVEMKLGFFIETNKLE